MRGKESLKNSDLFRKLRDPIGQYYNVFIKNDQAVKYPGEPLKTLAALVFQVGNHNGLVLVVLYNEAFPAAAWNGDNNSSSDHHK